MHAGKMRSYDCCAFVSMLTSVMGDMLDRPGFNSPISHGLYSGRYKLCHDNVLY